MESALRISSSRIERGVTTLILMLLSLLLMGAFSMKANLSDLENTRKIEREKVCSILRELSEQHTEKSRDIAFRNSIRDPYYYLLANSSELK